MSDKIYLSEEHGLNPCMMECYICGEVDGIALTGKRGEKLAREMGNADGAMPRQAVFSVEPCRKCKELGVAFIEMSHEGEGAEPTGRRCLMKREAAERFLCGEAGEQALKMGACFITPDFATHFGFFQQKTT